MKGQSAGAAGRTISLVLATALLLGGCTDKAQIEEAAARLRETGLMEFAGDQLSDTDLASAVPEPFELVEVQRNGFERHRKPWVTVGAKMDGPIRFARAIFYVHPNDAAAHEEFERQTGNDPAAVENDTHAKPWSLPQLDLPNACSAQLDRLFWCHAYKGSIHLVIQSSAGWPAGRNITLKERLAAKRLMGSFGAFLQDRVQQ